VLDLVSKDLLCDQIVLNVGYNGKYGALPAPAHGSVNLGDYTNSREIILAKVAGLYEKIVDRNLLIRRFNITANHVFRKGQEPRKCSEQLDLFDGVDGPIDEEKFLQEAERQRAVLKIQTRYGKNALLKGSDLQEGATARQRNAQIGGHRA